MGLGTQEMVEPTKEEAKAQVAGIKRPDALN